MKRIRKAITYVPKLLRLLLFCCVASSMLAAFSVRALAHTARDGMLSLGHSMMNYADQAGMPSGRQLQLNGATFQVAVGSTEDTVPQVLDVYEQRCDAVDGQMNEQLQEAMRNASTSERTALRAARTTVRVNADSQGYVACLDLGQARRTPGEIIERMRRFVETGDISAVGRMRYVFAERGTRRTRVLAIWSDSELNVSRMFPVTGDVPGQDPANVARPRGMTRLLSAAEVGQPYGLTMYTTQRSRDDVFGDYTREMAQRGWRRLDLQEIHSALDTREVQSFSRSGVNVTVVMQPMRGNGNAVTILSSR